MTDLMVKDSNELQSFNDSAAGSAVLAVLLGPIPVTAATGTAFISDFGACQVATAADGEFRLEISNDGFTYDVREISRINIVGGGTVMKSFLGGAMVRVGESYRVRYQQGTPGRCATEIFGRTEKSDIRD